MSNIEWTDRTWNPVIGCTPVSPGCLNCYAAAMARRLEGMGKADYAPRQVEAVMGTPYDPHTPAKTLRIAEVRGGRAVFTGEVRTLAHRLTEPLKWRKPCRVFVNSMSDLFHESVPFEFIDRVFAVMNATAWRLPIPNDLTKVKPWHTYQVLTKRPDRMAEYLASRSGKFRLGKHPLFLVRDMFAGHGVHVANASACFQWPLPNVWLGTSVENQAAADERIPHLLRCPAAVRFLSCEPLLEPVQLPAWLKPAYDNGKFRGWDVPGVALRVHGGSEDHFIDWVIVGGESGPGARPCEVDWVRSIVRQCGAAGVPCFVKQLGANVVGDPHVPPLRDEATGMTTYTVQEVFEINDRKGGDPSEWPEDLRVRQMPGCG
jgi:protein gp37